jgi:hypothetical protein
MVLIQAGRIMIGRLPVKTKIFCRINVILPVQSYFGKYLRSGRTQITAISPAVSFPLEGRFAIVTDVGNGMRWTRVARLTKRAHADGEVVWS